LAGVEAGLKARPAKIYRARRMVCELLHPQREAGIALPEVWNKNCRRLILGGHQALPYEKTYRL
jgi:hypothetical protein